MRVLRRSDLPPALLTACILGLVLCPFLYIAIGALCMFSPPLFRVIVLPPFLLGSGFLLWRFLSGPKERVTKIFPLVGEGISWIVVLAFLVLISGSTLQTSFEWLGSFCTFYLLTLLFFCLPLVLMRETALEQRLTKVPNGVSISLVLIILAISGTVAIVDSLTPPRFI